MPDQSAWHKSVDICRLNLAGQPEVLADSVVSEEPLEIRVGFRRKSTFVSRPVSITMRTPGSDPELAIGFLYTEGIVHDPSWIQSAEIDSDRENSILVKLTQPVDLGRLERHFFATSSCGICGRVSLEAVGVNRIVDLAPHHPILSHDMILGLVDQLRAHQPNFRMTGGVHAAGLFDSAGGLLAIFEDVGRHNAVDKLVGHGLLRGWKNWSGVILVVSGRGGFELVQKAIMTGIPAMISVGAPTSLSVDLARRYGMTLIGFAKRDRYNVYAGLGRIKH